MILRRSSIAVALLTSAGGSDWPQFRGPDRDGVSREIGLLAAWPEGGPKLAWTFADAGVGFSGPAVVGERIYLSGGRGPSEFVFALDLDGKELWSAKIGPLFAWKGNSWNNGPNASPTVAGDAVFALGGFGDLVCVAAADGKERWRVNLAKDLGGEVNPIGGGLDDPTPLGWGNAAAPLVDGDRVICVPGGKGGLFAALDVKTGKVVWRSTGVRDQAPYASPIVVDFGGTRQYISATNAGMVGVAAADGKVLWTYERAKPYEDIVAATPVFRDGYVFASVGFGEGFDLVQLSGKGGEFAAKKVASGTDVQIRDGGAVVVDAHLFGYSEKGGWVCQEFKSGKVIWADREALGRGSIAAADGRLYCVAEKGGAVALVEPGVEGWKESGRLKLPRESKLRRPSGALWTHPVIANGRLYVRDQELLFCYDVKK